MKDFLGNELNVNDKVVYVDSYNKRLEKGIVTGFSNDLVKMTNTRLNCPVSKASKHVVKDFTVEKQKLNDLLNDSFTPVCWPESQTLMDLEGFDENSNLINDEEGLEIYGSSAYFVNSKWLSEQE